MPRNAKKTKKKNPMQTAFTRFMLVVAFFILWIGGIGVRLVHLQINQHEILRDKALDQRRDLVKSKQLRGTIYDRTERALAMSVKVKSLYADPREIEDADAAAKEIAKALKVKPNEIAKNLKEAKEAGKRFVWLARKLDENAADKINEALENRDLKKYDLPRFAGLYWREEQKRSYPYQSLAAHVIGFSNADDIGSAGIEQAQEEILHGAVIKGWQDRDRLGRVYDESEEEQREPPKDIVLTLNHSIQYKTDLALEAGVKNSNAKSGMAIVLDPKTGEILAMSNYPTFDPNRYTEFATENYANRAIHDIYSPGSVFKLVTYGSAINENLINPDNRVASMSSSIEVAGHRFTDHHSRSTMTYHDAMAVSSNVTAIKTALGVGKERFHDYIKKFGFGKPVGVELPAETGGIVRSPKVWQGDSLASMSIGYEIGVSALQMATAFATIANDGERVQPHVIKEIRHADGKVFSATEPQKTRVVSSETARGLRKMLREVVVQGTGKRAQLNGYTSAGKTGTAWKFNPKTKRVDASKYISSFIGMAPADDPKVVIAVVMDEPKSGARDGGQVSAPVFREIAEGILPEMSVIPDANIKFDQLTAQEELPTEMETLIAPESDRIFTLDALSESAEENDAASQPTENGAVENAGAAIDKKAAANEKPAKETKAPKKEPAREKLPEIENKPAKPKTTSVGQVKPKSDQKNKSSGERTNEKTKQKT